MKPTIARFCAAALLAAVAGLSSAVTAASHGDVADTTDAAPTLLSAYLGAVNVPQIPFCPGGPVGRVDGLPLVVSEQIDNASLAAGSFAVTNSQGVTTRPSCVTLAPADEENEDNTILLVGDFVPHPHVPVVSVTVTGPVLTEGGSGTTADRSLQGQTITPVTGIDQSVALAQASVAAPEAAEIGAPDGCPGSTSQVLRATWTGGIRSATPPADVLSAISVIDRAGAPIPVEGVSATEEQDNDNVLDICLASNEVPVHLTIAQNTYVAPNGLANQFTEVVVVP
ncbi:MAG: hypothetical protein ACRCYQ_05170 [Nocardioides sp.]